jgi:hypothetical protein
MNGGKGWKDGLHRVAVRAGWVEHQRLSSPNRVARKPPTATARHQRPRRCVRRRIRTPPQPVRVRRVEQNVICDGMRHEPLAQCARADVVCAAANGPRWRGQPPPLQASVDAFKDGCCCLVVLHVCSECNPHARSFGSADGDRLATVQVPVTTHKLTNNHGN